jgi:hypothetical protein
MGRQLWESRALSTVRDHVLKTKIGSPLSALLLYIQQPWDHLQDGDDHFYGNSWYTRDEYGNDNYQDWYFPDDASDTEL